MYIIAKKNDMLTIINPETLSPFLPFEYEEIHICNGNAENLWVKIKGLWGLFNITTKSYILLPQFQDINYTSNHSCNCYTLIVTKGASRGDGRKCGAVNDEGKIIIPCIYDDLFGTPYGEYYQGKIRGKEGLLDANGHIVIDFIYDKLCCYNSRGKYPSILNGKYGVFAYGGRKIFDFVYDKIEYCEPFGCGYHVLIKDGKYGVHICGTGQIIPCQYNSRNEIPDFKLVSYY